MAQANTNILDTLNLTNAVRQTAEVNKAQQRRVKLLANLAEQRKLAEAMLKGEEFVAVRTMWEKNAEGKDIKVEKQKRVRSWFYSNDNKSWFLEVRYANTAVEVAKDKRAIAISSKEEIVGTIDKVIKAVEATELDNAIDEIVKRRK